MRQIINLGIRFTQSSVQLTIKNAYKINNRLVVVSEITPTLVENNAINTRRATLTVETNTAEKLAVDHYTFVSGKLNNYRQFTSTSNEIVYVIKSLNEIEGFNNHKPLNSTFDISKHTFELKDYTMSDEEEAEDVVTSEEDAFMELDEEDAYWNQYSPDHQPLNSSSDKDNVALTEGSTETDSDDVTPEGEEERYWRQYSHF